MIHLHWEVRNRRETMRFNELAQDASDDNYNKWDIDDTRRPKLTLKHINKMRKMRELAKAEHAERINQNRNMYARGGE